MSEKEIKALHMQRGNIKRILTNLGSALDKITDAKSIVMLDPQGRLQKLKETWAEFDKVQTRLEELVPEEIEIINNDDPSSEFRSPARDNFEERYFFLSASLKALLNPENTSSREISHSASTEHLTNSQENIIFSNIRLPTINLPTFIGTYDTWLGFSDTFKSIVHDNPKIPQIQKLHYLKSCLKDEAADLIASLETSSDNYTVAWNLLKDRYDNKRVIIENHTRAIIQAPVTSKEFSIRALLDHIQKHLRALRALGQPVDKWDTILLLLIKDKLNAPTREKFEDITNEITLPTMKDMITFLQRRAQFEDTKSVQVSVKSGNKNDSRNISNAPKKNPQQHAYVASQTSKPACFYCQGEHEIFSCEKFLKFSIKERIEETRKLSLCTNCLRPKHRAKECRSGPCRKCGKKHNSLLHIEEKAVEPSEVPNANNSSVNMQSHTTSHSLVSTAIVDIIDNQGHSHPCRILLDNGSQSHYMTEKMASLLKLPRQSVNIAVTGLNLASNDINESVSATFKSRFNNFEKKLDFLVVPHVTGTLPSIPINRNVHNIPTNLKLADPEFFKPAEVDALIGVQLFYKLICVGQVKLQGHEAILQKTRLGWIIAGDVSQRYLGFKNTTCHLTMNSTLFQNDELTRFWEIEEVQKKQIFSVQEQACESHFSQNVKRNDNGQYIVKLPFNENKERLGKSYEIALRRFYALENKFLKNTVLKEAYSNFLEEYEALNHMSLDIDPNSRYTGFFLPHHAVLKEDSLSTKTRVVFDGSMEDSNDMSLNKALMVGPTIQDDLFTIYTRFRSFPFALTADIEKMYRQIQVDIEDANYQKILWRSNPTEPIKIYKLKTVTYGTASAPFLGTRVLKQLAIDEGDAFPLAAKVLKRDFFVDDMHTGASTYQEALELRNELIELTKKGGFNLRKWASNDSRLINDMTETSETELMSLHSIDTIKTLGIFWNPKDDTILYSVKPLNPDKQLTKRLILSEIAKLFDPLGLLGPVIVQAKLIIQLLWKLQISWDEIIPPEV
ncbi:uncharacterized protein LOC122509722 [Leptopilina heterotoma]|uniref:uncharacterized protein LOC122509722 n=1 Tax=Leptopilina heterotoma TaxID=63436 RepID=UPI001CA853A4|nr:uncharacterized protein LOC122509722 [Leptopilina heterotoma]